MILRSLLPTLALSGALVSCGYDYGSETLTLRQGQILKTHHNGDYRLDRVDRESITLSATRRDIRQGWKLGTEGRWGGGEPHALGNNESLSILRTDPRAGTAELELSWLDSVGPLTMPPF